LANEKKSGKRSSEGLSAGFNAKGVVSLPRKDLVALIGSLTDQMRSAAGDLQFEVAAKLRDEIRILKKELRSMEEAGV
jgi:excinuclease ABC subunit B